MWLKTATLRERILCSLTPGAASLSSLLPKNFQEKLVMDECVRNNEIAKQSFPFGRKAKSIARPPSIAESVLLHATPSVSDHTGLFKFPKSASFIA